VNALRIVLVSPLHASNVGAIARLCGNFSVNDVFIVAPRCDILSDDARKLATHHTQPILENFKVCQTLREALLGVECVVGFSRRLGDMRRPDVAWPHLPALMSESETACLVFGPEDTGLSQDDLTLCSHLCSLPTHAQMPSMNLSQAVAVVLAGALWQGNMASLEKPAIKTRHYSEKPISSHGMLSLVEHWREVMVDVELNRDGNPDRLLHYYHRVLNRAQISDREANMLRGFLSQVQIKLGTRKTKKELDHGSES